MKKTNKTKLIIFSVLLLFLSSCSAIRTETYIIGANFDLSGPNKGIGQNQLQALELALDHFNVSGGYDGTYIELEVLDNKSDKEVAEANQVKLSENTNIFATISFGSKEVQQTIYSKSNELQMINVFSGIDLHDELETSEFLPDYNYNVAVREPFQGFLLGNYVRNMSFIRNVAVIDTDSNGNNPVLEMFQERYNYLKGKTTVYTLDNKQIDTELISNIVQNADHKAIVIPSDFSDNIAIIESIRQINKKIPIITVAGKDILDQKNITAEIRENLFILDHYTNELNHKQFFDDYFNVYNITPDKYSALGYDSMNLVLDSLVRANTTETKMLKESFDDTYLLTLLTGRISIDYYNNASKSMFMRYFSKYKEFYPKLVFPE